MGGAVKYDPRVYFISLLKIKVRHDPRSVETETERMTDEIEYVQKGHRGDGK